MTKKPDTVPAGTAPEAQNTPNPPPAAPERRERPTRGGTFVRQPDGTLKPAEKEA